MDIYNKILKKGIDCIKKYINNGNDLHVAHENFTLGRECVYQDRLDLLKLLIDNGYNVNHQSAGGNTILSAATFSGNIRMIKYILSLPGCDIDLVDHKNNTPFMKLINSFITKNKKEMVQLFLDHGININMKDSNGNTVKYYLTIGFISLPEFNEMVKKAFKQRKLINRCVRYINKNINAFKKSDLDNLIKDVRAKLLY